MPSVGRWPAAADRATRMTLGQPRDSTIGIVGDGFGSAFVYTTAVYLGFRPEQITVFGPSGNPVATYQQFAYNLGQTILRSESESHFLPADWPTFAQLDAWARRSRASPRSWPRRPPCRAGWDGTTTGCRCGSAGYSASASRPRTSRSTTSRPTTPVGPGT